MNDRNSNLGGYVPFSTLATSYSTDGSASNGGNLGIISGLNTGYINEYNNAMFTALSGPATLLKLANANNGF
jgi:parvulin-like peptidyl-prolyl isomerase